MLSFLMPTEASKAPNTSTLIFNQNEKSIILNTSNYTQESESVSITDAFDNIVFEDVIERYKHRVKYDLTTLPNGTYTIKVNQSNIITYYEVQITASIVNLLDTKSYYRPSIQQFNNKLIVKAALENKEDVKVRIYDNADDLVYQYHIEKNNSFSQTFNLENLPKGEYYVIVATDHFNEDTKIERP